MQNLVFKNPLFLLPLLLIPLLFWVRYDRRREASFHFPSLLHLDGIPKSWKVRLQPFLPLLRVVALSLLITALARPQIGVMRERVTEKGVDIMMAVDVSTSMLAEDFTMEGQRVNRLDVLKRVLDDFIPRRIHDRLGMVVFAGRPYTMAPLTWDQDWLSQRVKDLKIGMVEDGTAIGSAIMTSLNRLKDSKAKSKILILLTDGNNNRGEIQPEVAAETAKALGIKIYTIGAGSRGPVPYPMQDPFGRTVYQHVRIDIDDQLLTNVAEGTGGRYFRATGTEELFEIYQEIDRLERTEIEMTEFHRYRELYPMLILLALFFLGIELALQHTIMRRLP